MFLTDMAIEGGFVKEREAALCACISRISLAMEFIYKISHISRKICHILKVRVILESRRLSEGPAAIGIRADIWPKENYVNRQYSS